MTAPAAQHPTPMQAAARTNVVERLLAHIPRECDWRQGECVTRRRLYARVMEWQTEKARPDLSPRLRKIADDNYARAMNDHTRHHCEPKGTDALIAELVDLVGEACVTFKHATTADTPEHDAAYRTAMSNIRTWAAKHVRPAFADLLEATNGSK